MDSLGISEPGANAETEMLIKAEEEKRDLQYERDQLMSNVLNNKEELSALTNTLWMINIANEQFRQVVYPAGISLEDSEALRNTEEESQAVGIKLHICKNELKALEHSLENKKEKINQIQCTRDELQDVINECETKNEAMTKEITDIQSKISRADKCNSRLSLELRKKDSYTGIEEDIRIHLLREIRRTVSDLLFASVESKSAIALKIEQLFEETQIPLPARTKSSISSRSSSASSLFSKSSSKLPSFKSKSSSNNSTPSSSRTSSRADTVTPSVVMPGTFPSDSNKEESRT